MRLALPALLAALAVACAGEPRTFAALRESIAGLDPAAQSAAIESYVRAHGGTPLVENQSRLVFVVHATNGRLPHVVGDFNAWGRSGQASSGAEAGELTPVGDSGWAYLEGSGFTNARLEYVLLFDDEAVPDPLNPRTVEESAGPRSEVRMPQWQGPPELALDATGTAVGAGAAAPEGTVLAQTFPTQALGGTRRVWYYLPPGYEASQDVYPTVYMLDGGTYLERMHVPGILDRLIASHAIPPVIGVFVEPADRQEEYSRSVRWRRFITSELVSAVDARFRTVPSPDRRAILGSSLAAYGAVDLAVESPDVFGLCAAIAPPAETATIITNQAHAAASLQSVRFFVLGAAYDPAVDGARQLRTALGDASLVYAEVPEGHNAEMFRGRLDEAIGGLLAP